MHVNFISKRYEKVWTENYYPTGEAFQQNHCGFCVLQRKNIALEQDHNHTKSVTSHAFSERDAAQSR